MEMRGGREKKPRKAEQFIAALLSFPTIEAAAKATGISNATAWRWMRDPEFAEQYRQARRDCMAQATAQLQQATTESVEALRNIQRNGESEAARVSAARTILDSAFRAVELEEVKDRLDALEQATQEAK